MDKATEKLFGFMTLVLGIAGFVIFYVAFFSIYRGFVLTLLWKWFAVPIFNLPSLSLVEAIGVSVLVGFLLGGSRSYNDDNKDGKKLITAFMAPAVALLLGWVVHLFM